MGRLIFATILGLVAVLYVWLAIMAVIPRDGTLSGSVESQVLGVIIFLAMGIAAGIGSFSLLRQKGNR